MACAPGWLVAPLPLPLLLLLLAVWPAPVPAQPDQEPLEDGQLGARCLRSGRCHVPLSHCEKNVCVCPPRTVAAAAGRRCLHMAEQLGDVCEEDAQCGAVAHAVCRRPARTCECRRGRVAAGGRCLAAAQLGEACEHQAQCQGLTECSAASRRCVCAGIAFEAGGRCVTDDADGVRDWEPPPPRSPDADAAGVATSPLRSSVFAVVVVLLLAWQQVR
ncbi:hypothetical protein R5R35_012192 [Gryllus longicercus]|uniref:EB domain-containing protein n=1 Tax=Gryllus longicercus TaxID=2509291 RepID=A0AAN9W012_9ORTH